MHACSIAEARVGPDSSKMWLTPVANNSAATTSRSLLAITLVGAAPSNTCAPFGSTCVPQIMRSGFLPSIPSRGIRCGSSAMTVCVPTMMASTPRRTFCTSALDASLVIHLDVPSNAAIFPSSVAATFHVINGRPLIIFVSHARLE